MDRTMIEPTLSPRAARTRSALLAAGLELLAERPVDAIAIDEVVAGAISRAIRVDVEALVWRTNRDIADPLERLAGGMIAAAAFALAEPKRAAVLTRSSSGTVVEDHPLNRGLLEDMRAALADGLVSPEGGRAGVLYWLGCCQIVMASSVVQRASVDHAAGFVADMLALGLRGLGASASAVARIADPERVRQHLRAITSA
jgi:AcrR family transcriptional regulator